LSRWLMRLTIQLNNRPYNALAIASLTPAVSERLLCLTIVSPRAIMPDVVNASVSSLALTPTRLETTQQINNEINQSIANSCPKQIKTGSPKIQTCREKS